MAKPRATSVPAAVRTRRAGSARCVLSIVNVPRMLLTARPLRSVKAASRTASRSWESP